ncbi:MAG: hypothetical protein JWQ89_619 [Devosia sp.]|nr:hypothetical protein [Devosia sp.]
MDPAPGQTGGPISARSDRASRSTPGLPQSLRRLVSAHRRHPRATDRETSAHRPSPTSPRGLPVNDRVWPTPSPARTVHVDPTFRHFDGNEMQTGNPLLDLAIGGEIWESPARSIESHVLGERRGIVHVRVAGISATSGPCLSPTTQACGVRRNPRHPCKPFVLVEYQIRAAVQIANSYSRSSGDGNPRQSASSCGRKTISARASLSVPPDRPDARRHQSAPSRPRSRRYVGAGLR